jgi:hypothetical protein
LLNEAREKAERIIDMLYGSAVDSGLKKPRDYREVARRDYLAFTKRRRPGAKARRNAIKTQLQYLKRDLQYIEMLLAHVPSDRIGIVVWRQLEVLQELYAQQDYMWRNRVCRVDHRIVSISQPHVRPIVRGKAGKPVEFGAKISMSLVDGFCFIDRLSWESYNESQDLPMHVEKYKERYGVYPESIHADQIYLNRENRRLCREVYRCRLSGKPLGRPKVENDKNREEILKEKNQRHQDHIDRIAIEGRFGVGKRRYGLNRIKMKLSNTSETAIHIAALVMNLDKILEAEMKENREIFRIHRKAAA